MLGLHNNVIPSLPREERDRLREQLEQQARNINEAIAGGWRIDRVEYVVAVDEGGYNVLMFMAKP